MTYLELEFKGETQKLWFEKIGNQLWIHWKERTFIYPLHSIPAKLPFNSEAHTQKKNEKEEQRAKKKEEVHQRKDSLISERKETLQPQKGEILAPLSGRIVEIFVKEGEKVQSGQVLVVMEAMKMEYRLKAESHGEVIKLNCKEGEVIEMNQVVLVLQSQTHQQTIKKQKDK